MVGNTLMCLMVVFAFAAGVAFGAAAVGYIEKEQDEEEKDFDLKLNNILHSERGEGSAEDRNEHNEI